MNRKQLALPLLGGMLAVGGVGPVAAKEILVTVENLSGAGGLYFTPLWAGFHDGSFDSFDIGSTASPSVEALAEGGDASSLSADISGVAGSVDGVITAPAGFPGAAVFDPGDTGSLVFGLDPILNRYFSFASMIIPSNDAFIGNDNPTAYEVFDAAGNFNGVLDIVVLGTEVWDGGTEVNDGFGAAFSTLGGTATDQTLSIDVHTGLGPLLGTVTAAGTTLDSATGDFTQPGFQVARITLSQVPLPPTLLMMGLGLGIVAMIRRLPR